MVEAEGQDSGSGEEIFDENLHSVEFRVFYSNAFGTALALSERLGTYDEIAVVNAADKERYDGIEIPAHWQPKDEAKEAEKEAALESYRDSKARLSEAKEEVAEAGVLLARDFVNSMSTLLPDTSLFVLNGTVYEIIELPIIQPITGETVRILTTKEKHGRDSMLIILGGDTEKNAASSIRPTNQARDKDKPIPKVPGPENWAKLLTDLEAERLS